MEIRLICVAGGHAEGQTLTVSEIAELMTGTGEPLLPEGWEHLPADLIDDPFGGPPVAKFNPESTTYIVVCPEHITSFQEEQ